MGSDRIDDVTNILKQDCRSCSGAGTLLVSEPDPNKPPTLLPPCPSCSGTGVRFVPEGYSQDEISVVRSLVDAMAMSRGV